MGSTRALREGEDRSVRFENWMTSLRKWTRTDPMGVLGIKVVSFEVDVVLNVEDTERDIERMCWLEELTLRGVGAIVK